MLKVSKLLLPSFVLSIIVLQLWLVFNLQLFGDEAFYWLEGHYLDWSYTDLPGWSAWMIRLGTEIFGNHYFAVRSVSYLNFIGLLYACHLIGKEFAISLKYTALLFAVPLFVLIATMALPDIWLLVFVVWLSYFFIVAIKYKQIKYWIILGALLALSINVHVRMWIWLVFASIAFVILFFKDSKIIKPALLITLPIALLGLLPVLYFNFTNDFALFVFQFGRRHPWEFQLSNLNFVFSQFIVITPIVLFVWFKGITRIQKQPRVVKWILLTALIHAIFYLVTSLFADGLRTTVHWLLVSYIPVLVLLPYLLPRNKKLINSALISGGIVSLFVLINLGIETKVSSSIQARILDNSLGWKKLAKEVDKNLKVLGVDNLVADYFMTAAELAFELEIAKSIKVLPHEKSVKHGRQKQLQIMGLLLTEPQSYRKNALLVVEDSTLKLKNKGKYYAQLCHYFPQMRYIETVNVAQTNKQFHLFNINNGGTCEIPPMYYVTMKREDKLEHISGWVILDKIGIKSLSLVSVNEVLISNFRLENIGIVQQFPEINDPDSPNNGFEIKIPVSKINTKRFRIKATGNNGKVYLSPEYYIN